MATIVTAAEASPEVAAPVSAWARAWQFLEARLIAITERANPILVKEARQALKSRQFVLTFLVVLAACWIVSFGGVAMIGPQIYYSAAGSEMLIAYFAVLAFPLTMIVPYSAYRSLAAEQEENTFDLLAITTLSSRQIITGKLWSAIVQMAVYLSAVAPCIAFTFLLRGVDALTTAFLLVLAAVGSLGLSMLSLFVGASARAKHTQVVTSVALVLALFGAFWSAIGIATGVVWEGIPREEGFWVAMFIIAMIYVTSFGLLHAAAAAQISFPSENRSTPIRRWMMAQQACFVGGVAGAVYTFSEDWRGAMESNMAAIIAASAYWWAMGALMTSEWPHLSRRVERSLPQSTVGRTFLSFFNPGPGAGYMFAVANLTTLALAAGALAATASSAQVPSWLSFETIAYATILLWGYVVAYLGLGRLLVSSLRKWMFVSLTAGFLFHVVLVMAGVGIPMTIQMASRTLRNQGWTLLQTSNPFWTIAELLDHGPTSVQAPIIALVVPAAAIAMLLFNMRSVAAELRRHRAAPPLRVAEEEALLHPTPAPGPTNPWDAEAGESP